MTVISASMPGDPDSDLRDAARRLLLAIGEDTEREGLVDTPRRVAESLAHLTEGYLMHPSEVVRNAIFEHAGQEPVTMRDVPFYSLCEHHLLPFFGRCHVAYMPSGKVLGLSKLPRLVDVFAHRLQLQERLTEQIANAVEEVVDARGVAVVMEARHMCLEMRGVEKHDSDTVTSCYLGEFEDDAVRRAEFLQLIQRR